MTLDQDWGDETVPLRMQAEPAPVPTVGRSQRVSRCQCQGEGLCVCVEGHGVEGWVPPGASPRRGFSVS